MGRPVSRGWRWGGCRALSCLLGRRTAEKGEARAFSSTVIIVTEGSIFAGSGMWI